jgi:TorA maturation chaperone TorD
LKGIDIEHAVPASLDPVEEARARWYGLISRLFYGPADSGLLAEISGTGQGEDDQKAAGELMAAWRGLQAASRTLGPDLIRLEYENLFLGVGKAEVTPYVSGYAESAAPDRYIVRLRDRLAAWGLARRQGAFEVEDHISGISDIMRRLIEERQTLPAQRSFFEEFAYDGAVRFFAAVQNASSAQFYTNVAALALAFFVLEKAAFEMSDAGS